MKRPLKSIRYPVAIDRGLGQLAAENKYEAHIEQMIRQVLLTNPGDRINRPDFGCGLRRMVFAPNSDVTANLVQVSVLQALEKWLGTAINVEKIDVTSENETLEVLIQYVLKAKRKRRILNVEVSI
ncbi:MAG: GPW/gp25 family protein [Myxococcota bacterium]